MADVAKYLLLIYGNEREWAAMPPGETAKLDAAHRAFQAAAERTTGVAVLDGHELEPPDVATTLRTDGAGRATTTDGPFLETKEELGGYYMLEADDLDGAIEIAAQIPATREGNGAVEIRPLGY
jgi:hypothetical protein